VARPTNGQAQGNAKYCQADGCGVEVPPHELKESWESFKRILCRTHREEMRHRIAARPAV
jgi:hypothetical protein